MEHSQNTIISLNHSYHFKIRMYLDHNKFKDREILLEWLTSRYSSPTCWTYGEETSLKSQRLHYHLHVIIETGKEYNFTKTPLMQLFKTWYSRQYPKGIPLEKNSFSIKYEKDLKSRDDFLSYPLKCLDHVINRENYNNVPDIQLLHASGRTLFRKKLEYIKEKQLRDETRNNTWKSLVIFITDKCSEDPRWELLVQQMDEYENEDYLGKIKNITQASQIIGPYIIEYYCLHHDCDIPFNISKIIYKYLLQKKLVHYFQIYNILK